jgi:hypothetical protein
MNESVQEFLNLGGNVTICKDVEIARLLREKVGLPR